MTPQQPTLSTNEWLAVSVALNDATHCGCGIPAEPGSLKARLARAARFVTGRAPANGLADPRLESLRRFVCETRRRRATAVEHVPALVEHGFNQAQLDALSLLSR
ncbi:MAG: hypothetical protein ACOY45_09850 [Pseudomonadota bacterium]